MTRAGLRIAVVTPRYALSGVPLAQWRFAAALAEAGHQVDLIIGHCDADLAVPPAPGVAVRVLGCGRTRGMVPAIWRYLRRERPDAMFSAEDHLNSFVLAAAIAAGSRTKISGSCRVTPFDTYSNTPFTKRWVLKWAARAVAWRADALTCVSEDMVGQYRQVFPKTKHVSVYNIVDTPAAHLRMRETVDHPWFVDETAPLIVAAGSLAPWKGFADLIDAMAILLGTGRRARLAILGGGPLHDALQARIEAAGIGESVQLIGRVENPLKYFARADVFALSSHVEGLPNVLVEAMLCGCTPVSTDCPTGPREVLHGGRYGYLCPVGDTEAMADRLAYALDHPIARDLLAEAVTPFRQDAVLQHHFALLGLDAG